jgi:hypothetical protein
MRSCNFRLVHELLRAWKHCLLFVGGFLKKQYLLNINTLPSNHPFKRSFFDIRCVLLSNGWGHASRQAAAAKFGVDYGEMNYLHEFIFNVYELGSITLLDYLDRVLFYSLRSFTREAFKELIFAQSIELPHTLPWLIRWNQQNWIASGLFPSTTKDGNSMITASGNSGCTTSLMPLFLPAK